MPFSTSFVWREIQTFPTKIQIRVTDYISEVAQSAAAVEYTDCSSAER